MSRREPAGVPPEPLVHECRPPRWMVRAVVALALVALLAVTAIAIGGVYVYQGNQYVQGRGDYRDREAAALEKLMRDLDREAACDLLDQLPEGGLLDRPRAKYGCGPGIPLEDLPPEQVEQLQRQRGPAPTTPLGEPPTSAAPPAPSPSSGEPPQAAPGPPSPTSPTSSSEPPPIVDLGPATDLACESIRVCF